MNEHPFGPEQPEPLRVELQNEEEKQTIKDFVLDLVQFLDSIVIEAEDIELKGSPQDIEAKKSEIKQLKDIVLPIKETVEALIEPKPHLDESGNQIIENNSSQNIIVGPRKIRERDEAHVRAGYDEGAYVEIPVEGGKLQLNIVGGVRVVRSKDFKDSLSAIFRGDHQAARTSRYANSPTQINLEFHGNSNEVKFRFWLKFLAGGPRPYIALNNASRRLEDGSDLSLEHPISSRGSFAQTYSSTLKQMVEEVVFIKNKLIEETAEQQVAVPAND